MDITILEILEYLEPFGVGVKKDISNFINKKFIITANIQEYEFRTETGNVLRFLNSCDAFIDYTSASLQYPDYRNNPIRWFDNLPASVKNEGIEALKKHRDRSSQERVHQSEIDTNNSIIATNSSVINTNAAIIENSKSQTSVNETLVKNSALQTAIFRRQTRIFFATAILALCALLISIWSIIEGKQSQQLQMQLQQKQREIDTLQIQLLQLKNLSYHRLMEKKVLTRKP